MDGYNRHISACRARSRVHVLFPTHAIAHTHARTRARTHARTHARCRYQAREAETAELGRDIQHLWDLLQIDPKFQQYFSEKYGGIGLTAVEACRDERQRLLIKKEKLLPRIVEHERAQIARLFDQTSCDAENQVRLFVCLFVVWLIGWTVGWFCCSFVRLSLFVR